MVQKAHAKLTLGDSQQAELAVLRAELRAERQRRVHAERSEQLQRERFAKLRASLSNLLQGGGDHLANRTSSENMPSNQSQSSATRSAPPRMTPLLYVHGAGVDAANGPYTRLSTLRIGYAAYVNARGCELHMYSRIGFLGWGLTCGGAEGYLYMTHSCVARAPTSCTWFALSKAGGESNSSSTLGAQVPTVSTSANVPSGGAQQHGEHGTSVLQLWLPLWAMRAHPIVSSRAHSFGPAPSHRTCAVVGSSGALLHDRLGAEIDSHDVVVRFNDAPTDGYEPIVGGKSSIRLLNTKAAFSVIKRCAAEGTCEVTNRSCCPSDAAVLLNSGRRSIAECFQKVCGPVANIFETLSQHPLSHSLRATSNGTGRMMSGAFGVSVALLLCKRRINLYGFSVAAANVSASYVSASDASAVSTASPYHYYVSERAPDLKRWMYLLLPTGSLARVGAVREPREASAVER